MSIFLIVVAFLLAFIAILGCLLPGLPGTPFAYVGFLMLHFNSGTPKFSTTMLVVITLITLLGFAVDYIMPMIGTKKFGGSKYGSWGALLGLIIGIFTPIPGGIIIGPLAGAVLGELYAQKELPQATKAGLGAILGMLSGSIIKLIITSIIVIYMVKNVV